MSDELPAIQTNQLFRGLARRLITLLRGLSFDSWTRPTCYPNWTVHDIAVHLLQTSMSRLSSQRDGFAREGRAPNSDGFESLCESIDADNTLWTDTLSPVSPRIVVNLLEKYELQLARFLRHIPSKSLSSIGVAWAGEHRSPTWFDTAREFTERWHHQQQIRDAVGAPDITGPKYLRPVISTLVRAVPYWYADLAAPEGSSVDIHVEGESGGRWQLRRLSQRWRISQNSGETKPAASVTMSQDTAWRFLTRTIPARQAERLMTFWGDETLSRHFLQVIAVMIPEHLR